MENKEIAIIEDDELTITIYKRLLGKKYSLEFYRSGEEFFDSLKNSKLWDLVIIDLSLRGEITGIDIIKYLKNDISLKNIPAICITAHAFAKDRQAAVDAGIDKFFLKPVDNKVLLNTIEQYLSLEKSDKN